LSFINFPSVENFYTFKPSNLREVKNNKEWGDAMDVEFSSSDKNKTWNLVKFHEEKKSISYKRIFQIKYKVDFSIEKYKVRLVVKGYAY
jgi:hypothetical protein